MKKELRNRLNGLEYMIRCLNHNAALLEYLSYELHNERFNLFNNLGLIWIWRRTMGDQLTILYKIMVKKEKFSFAKIINVAKGAGCDIDSLEEGANALMLAYNNTNYQSVRSKHIAHQDLDVMEMKTDLSEMGALAEKATRLFLLCSKTFKGRTVKLSTHVVDSLGEIFSTIGEYERVKGLLAAERIHGNEVVKISRLLDVIRDQQRENREKKLERKKVLKSRALI